MCAQLMYEVKLEAGKLGPVAAIITRAKKLDAKTVTEVRVRV